MTKTNKSLYEAFQDMLGEHAEGIEFSNSMFNIGYMDGEDETETQYTVLREGCTAEMAQEELQEFFHHFCKEDGLEDVEVTYVEYAGPDPYYLTKTEMDMAEKLGITQERYLQMRDVWQDVSGIKEAVETWGVEAINKGYGSFDHDGTGMLEISAISDVGAFDDEEATRHAAADGIKIIPVEDLPANMPEELRYYGWIDTPENRQAIQKYCDKYWEAVAKSGTGNALMTLLVNLGFADEAQEHLLFQVPGNRLQEAKEQVQKGKEAYDALPFDNFQTLEDCIEKCFKRELIPYNTLNFDVLGIRMDS